MDFRGLNGYVLTHEEDSISGDLTVTIKNLSETVVIGTIVLEPMKLKALADSLAETADQLLERRTDSPYRRRTIYTKNLARAKTEFFI
jgi:hypothetical protein